MVSARSRRALLIALPPLWGAALAAGCIYPELSTSPDWQAAGASNGASGGTSNGGSSNSGASSNGAGDSALGGAMDPGSAGEGGAGNVVPDTISGKVVDQYGLPIAGVPILIDDVELETDADGSFTTPADDRISFRAVAIDTELKAAHVYEGISRRQLRFMLPRAEGDWHTAQISGTGSPDDPDNFHVFFASQNRLQQFYGTKMPGQMPPDVDFEIAVTWGSATSFDGSIVALSYSVDPVTLLPSTYYAGEQTLTLMDGDVAADRSVPTPQIDSRALQVSIRGNPGGTVTHALLLGPAAISNTSPAPQQQYTIPHDTDFGALNLRTYFTAFCNGPVGSATLSIPIDPTIEIIDEACPSEVPALSTPANMAMGVAINTPFVFTPDRSGCNIFTFSHGTYNMYVYTTESDVLVPDVAKWGMPWGGHSVTWMVSTSSPCSSINGFLAEPVDELPAVLPATLNTQSEIWTFTGSE